MVAVQVANWTLTSAVETTFSIPVIVVFIVILDCHLASLFPLLLIFFGDLGPREDSSSD